MLTSLVLVFLPINHIITANTRKAIVIYCNNIINTYYEKYFVLS